MKRRSIRLLSILLAASCSSNDRLSETSQALEPTSEFSPTTYTVTLKVQAPSSPAFPVKTSGGYYVCCLGANCSCSGAQATAINFTPDVILTGGGASNPTCGDFESLGVPSWTIAAVLGAQVNNGNWDNQTCSLGDLSRLPGPNYPCAAALPGTTGPGLAPGNAGTNLTRTFHVQSASDQARFFVSLDNVGCGDPGTVGPGILSAYGGAANIFGNLLSVAGSFLQNSGTFLGVLGSTLSSLGSLLQSLPSIDQRSSTLAQTACLGGILGNPPPGSIQPQDTLQFMLTGQQLYDQTQNGPLTVNLSGRINYQPAHHPQNSPWCLAATEISFIIDRGTPNSTLWTDGLAFEPRSADNAVVRRANAVESFRVDPYYGRLEHDSWQYAASEASYHPADGLALCNGSLACSPADGATGHRINREATGNYIAGPADPSGLMPPRLTNATTPVTALSPDPKHIAAFFVDDNGRLYITTASYPDDDDTSDVGFWQTWLLASGLPARAQVAALRATRTRVNVNTPVYTVFWAGTDNAVHTAVVNGDTYAGFPNPSVPVPTAAISSAITSPGARIAAVSRMPGVGDVFVVGNAISRLTGLPGSTSAGDWTVRTVGPTTWNVSLVSGVTAVATTVNNLDLFYFDVNRNLKHLAWNNLPPPDDNRWDWGASTNAVGASPLTLSAVSRSPNNIDLAYACGTTLCDLSLVTNTFVGLTVSAAPLFPASLPVSPSSPFSMAAASNFALDVVAASGANAYDLSWQTGATSWAMTAAQPTYPWGDGRSFRMYVNPKQLSIAANNSASVTLNTLLVNPADASRTITLSTTTAPGINAGQYNPTTVAAGNSTSMGFWVPLSTPPTPNQTITITGDNGVERHSVTFQVSTTACVPLLSCGSAPACGSISNGCGGTIQCGASCCTAADVCTPDTCGSTLSNRCGGTVKCPACRVTCPIGKVYCSDGSGGYACVPPNYCQ